MSSSSSSTYVDIYIVNNPKNINEVGTRFTVTNPDIFKRQSPIFRRLIDSLDDRKEGEGPKLELSLPGTSFIDLSVVTDILKKLQNNLETVIGDGDTKSLARYCAALYHYQCIPDLFEKSWMHLENKSSKSNSNGSSLSGDVQPKNKSRRESLCSWGEFFSRSTCGHLITIAFVLGNREILEEEMRLAVWETELPIDIPLVSVNIEALRKRELNKLFNRLQREFDRHENTNEDVIKSSRKKLKGLGDLSRSSTFFQNSEILEKHTPRTFLWGIECILSGPPDQTPTPIATPTSSQRADRVGPTFFPNEMARIGKLSQRKHRESQDGTIDKIVASLNNYKRKRQRRLAMKLMMMRNMTIDGWRRRLEAEKAETMNGWRKEQNS